jgi:hypothetical protein
MLCLAGGGQASVPAASFSRRGDGSLYLPLSLRDLRGADAGVSRVTGSSVGASPHPGQSVAQRSADPEQAETVAPGQVARVPVIEERVRVDKRVVEAGGVAVQVTPREREEVVDVPLVEEIGVRKDVGQETQKVRDTVRRTEVEVEQLETDPRYAPAREFVTQFAAAQRYRGRKWDEVEADARTSFEQRHPGKWNEYRDAIRAGYDRNRTRTGKAAT